MENKQQYINSEIENRIEGLKEFNDKYKKKELRTFIMCIGLIGLGFCSLPILPNLGLAATSLGIGVFAYKYKCAKRHDATEGRVKQEIGHLKRLQNKNPLNTEERLEKAKGKVLAISKSQIEAEKSNEIAEDITNIAYVITALGALSTLIDPWTAWLPTVAILSSILAGNMEIKTFRGKELLENRLNNLINDIDVNNIEEKEKIKVIQPTEKKLVEEIKYQKENKKAKVYKKEKK